MGKAVDALDSELSEGSDLFGLIGQTIERRKVRVKVVQTDSPRKIGRYSISIVTIETVQGNRKKKDGGIVIFREIA